MLSQWLASGQLIDSILVIVALEALLLSLWHRRTGRGLAPRQLLPNLLAGGSLLLALRLGLAGAPAYWLAAALLLALLAHLTDLYLRIHRQ
jgi:hypothetical protein